MDKQHQQVQLFLEMRSLCWDSCENMFLLHARMLQCAALVLMPCQEHAGAASAPTFGGWGSARTLTAGARAISEPASEADRCMHVHTRMHMHNRECNQQMHTTI